MTKSNKIIHLEAMVPDELSGMRFDRVLAQLFPDYSRACLQEWIRGQQVRVNDKILKPKEKVYSRQAIVLHAELPEPESWQAQDISLDVIYEDDDIIIVNKPVGLVVHPGAGNRDRTLVNALLHRFPELSQLPRAGVVHRIDKDTSGLLVVARTLPAHNYLIKQLQKHQIQREYLAVVDGVVTAGGTVDSPIGRHPTQRTRMAVVAAGKPARTHYRVIERFAAHSLLKVILETGRTHQIRVHMASIGHPLVGDPVYNRLKIPAKSADALKLLLHNCKRQALHARQLSLTHPRTQLTMVWESSVPEDIHLLIENLQKR